MNFYEKRAHDAIVALDALLALPPIPDDGMYSDGERFNPWDLFPCVYGTYSSAFDDMAIEVLEDIRDGVFDRDDLASEMFREMLCTAGLCDYGTSPRVCFATTEFKTRLPRLIERWREYSQIHWHSAPEALSEPQAKIGEAT
jgi:hypothetical protein